MCDATTHYSLYFWTFRFDVDKALSYRDKESTSVFISKYSFEILLINAEENIYYKICVVIGNRK